MNLVETIHLSKCYQMKARHQTYAVSGVNLAIQKGEILGLVGESGCGKSTLGKLLLKLESATTGEIWFKGREITQYTFDQMRPLRKNMQMIFQNSQNAFNPYLTVRQIIQEPLNNYLALPDEAAEQVIVEMLERVGLNRSHLSRYSGELSGGQRQRVGIARALVLKPEFVVCDEPTSSVDFGIRNQILTLLQNLKEEMGLTYLFISHDLSAVNKICNRVIIMYLGRIVEMIPSMNRHILHPYTQALMAAALPPDPEKRGENKVLFREEEENSRFEAGCIFQNRCLYTRAICRKEVPVLKQVNPGHPHYVACHRHGGLL